MRMKQQEIELISFVKKGRQRRLVIVEMNKITPLMVSEIQKHVNNAIKKEGEKEIRLSDVSRVLQSFIEKKLAVCLNPRKKVGEKGILYKLTEKGEDIKSVLSQSN